MSQRREDASGLTPIVYRDFTAGLYERGNDREVPLNGLLECTDCMPLPSGGLRAAWAWTEEPTGTIPTNRRVVGFHVDRGAVAALRLLDIQTALMLCSTSNADGGSGGITYEYWTAAGTTAFANLTTWTSGPSHSSLMQYWPVTFQPYFISTGVAWYYNIGGSSGLAGTRVGAFSLGANLASTVSTQVSTASVGYIAVHQDRMIYLTRNLAEGSYFTLKFTNPATNAEPPSSNTLDIAPNYHGNIGSLEPVFPQDLFVLKQGYGGFVIQGDLGSGPLVRETIRGHAPERITWARRTPHGFAYLTENEGIWLWSGGNNQFHLSNQILGSPMTEVTLVPQTTQAHDNPGFLGTLGYGGRWLFTPKGYVYDMEHKWWFRSTLPGTAVYSFWSYDDLGGRIYATGHKEPGDDIRILSASINESSMIRASSTSATLPLLDTQERSIQVRYIEVFGQGFGNGGTWQLELTNSKGETELTPLKTVPARAASARFDTKLQGDWLKIRVLSQGNPDASQSVTQASEAPMIDRIVVWARPKTRRI